jgi:TM2 domain-containing membrane protein YozV/RNA polymerase subunit RPABC4/transcription elongation factor Spt4
MTCDRCGTNVGDLAACPKCGSAVTALEAAAPMPASMPAPDAKACQFCGEMVRASAVKCRFCGSDLGGAALLEAAGAVPGPAAARAAAGNIVLNASPAGGVREQPSIVIQNVQSSTANPVPLALKSPGLAAVLSFFVTGLGQFYNGDIVKGLVLIVVQMVNVALMFVVVGFFTAFLTWVYGMVDAHNSAVRINARGY